MKAISAYMANRSTDGDARRREYEDRTNEHRPDQYNTRNAMGTYQPEANEMRRRRDSRGRYMMDEDAMPESRYRGRDGRWKAGRRRSEYDGGAYDNEPTGARMSDDEEGENMPGMYMPGIRRPYAPNRIGFGESNRHDYETRSHYDGGKAAAKVGGTMWMETIEEDDELMELDRVTAERWVQGMKNEDPARPKGARWSMEEVKPYAQKFGVEADGEEMVEFWAMMNAMYSDYSGVAKRFNITSPEFYAQMAKAWMDDKDAVPNKTALYYKCCVKK